MTDQTPSAAPRTGAAIIAEALKRAGSRHAFGIPGGEVLALMGALDEAGISFHLTKHENGAGFMAEGAWHAAEARRLASSRAVEAELKGVGEDHDAEHVSSEQRRRRAQPMPPGILLATLGPGVANAVNSVANAMQDRVPLIFLTGCVDGALGHSYTHQVFDHQAMLRPIVKGSFRAETGAVGIVIAKAIALATEGQPGPVHIDVPIGVAENPSVEASLPAVPLAYAGHADMANDAARAWSGAKRPLTIIGVDAVNAGAQDALIRFAKRHHGPIIETYKAKGMSAGLPGSLGGHGLSPRSDATVLPLVKAADVVLLVGYDPIEMRVGWRHPFAEDATIIEIAPGPRDHGMHHPTHALYGDVAATLDAFATASEPDGPVWERGEPARARAALAEAFTPSADWGPGQVFATMRKAMPDDSVITADSGAHRILLSQMWTSPSARTMLQSSALCTMACSVPIAAGFKLAAPHTPVVAFVGDAGLEMGLGELATLREHGIPLIVCVLVDRSLTLIEMKQRASQRPNVGVDFTGSDFPAVAEAMGGTGVWIDDAEALAREATAALTRDHFTLLACRIPRRAYDGTF